MSFALGMPHGFWTIFWSSIGFVLWICVISSLPLVCVMDEFHWSVRWGAGILTLIIIGAGCAVLLS